MQPLGGSRGERAGAGLANGWGGCPMGEGRIVCILAGVPRGAHFGWMGGGGELLGWMQLAGVLLSAVGRQAGRYSALL